LRLKVFRRGDLKLKNFGDHKTGFADHKTRFADHKRQSLPIFVKGSYSYSLKIIGNLKNPQIFNGFAGGN